MTKRKHAHNTRHDTQCSKKARLDRYFHPHTRIRHETYIQETHIKRESDTGIKSGQ